MPYHCAFVDVDVDSLLRSFISVGVLLKCSCLPLPRNVIMPLLMVLSCFDDSAPLMVAGRLQLALLHFLNI